MILITLCAQAKVTRYQGSRTAQICLSILLTLTSSYAFLYLQITFLTIIGGLLSLELPTEETVVIQFSQSFAMIFAMIIILVFEYLILSMIYLQIVMIETNLRLRRGGNL